MTTKYAVLNPLEGGYIKVETKEEVYSVLVKNIIQFYKVHSHSYSISEIQVDEHGNETWSSLDNGTELPQEYIDQIKNGISE